MTITFQNINVFFFFLAYKYMDANTASHSSNKKKITFNVNKILVLKT